MTHPAVRRWTALLLPGCVLGASLGLAGCGVAGSVAGAIAGGATGAGTANPVVGTAVALGTKAAVDTLLDYLDRKRRQGEQDAIVAAIGTLPVGGTVAWQVRHTIPFGNASGDLQVTRLIETPLAQCKEVVFTVVDGDERSHFATTACQQATQWKWAQAEPATERWGFLQ